MRYLSVCSGIEAATVAWHPLGWEPIAFSEIDKFPAAVLAHHYPDVPNWGDMTKFKEWPDAAIDVLVGGTPCQSFSVAGLRAGLADPRGNLMLTYLAIAARYRPQWVVWENVPGVLSSNGGHDFASFLRGLGELGYGFAYRVLDAQYFGLAQRRQRVFVVGCAGSWQRAAAVLFERASLSGHPAPRREAGQRVANAITERPDRGGGNSEGQRLIPHPMVFQDSEFGVKGYESAGSLRAGRIPEHQMVIAHSLRADGFDASEDGTGRWTPLVPVANSLSANSGRMQVESTYVPVAFHENQRGEITINDTAGSLKIGGGKPGQGYPAVAFDTYNQTVNAHTCQTIKSPQGGLQESIGTVMQNMQVRRLTPLECCRLQGFHDDYLDITYRGKPAADGPKYKALGNSMAVPCMAWIGKRIAAVDVIR